MAAVAPAPGNRMCSTWGSTHIRQSRNRTDATSKCAFIFVARNIISIIVVCIFAFVCRHYHPKPLPQRFPHQQATARLTILRHLAFSPSGSKVRTCIQGTLGLQHLVWPAEIDFGSFDHITPGELNSEFKVGIGRARVPWPPPPFHSHSTVGSRNRENGYSHYSLENVRKAGYLAYGIVLVNLCMCIPVDAEIRNFESAF